MKLSTLTAVNITDEEGMTYPALVVREGKYHYLMAVSTPMDFPEVAIDRDLIIPPTGNSTNEELVIYSSMTWPIDPTDPRLSPNNDLTIENHDRVLDYISLANWGEVVNTEDDYYTPLPMRGMLDHRWDWHEAIIERTERALNNPIDHTNP